MTASVTSTVASIEPAAEVTVARSPVAQAEPCGIGRVDLEQTAFACP